MKSIKDLRESYNLITEKEEHDMNKLTQLVRAGLFDAKKLSALKRAMDKPADKMTAQEKRMLINLLDALMSEVLSDKQVYRKIKQDVMMKEAVVVDTKDYLSKIDPRVKRYGYSQKEAPSVLLLKRKAIRVFPDGQKVALYYAQAIDKYVSIPFSEIGINEELELNEISLSGIISGITNFISGARGSSTNNSSSSSDDVAKELKSLEREKTKLSVGGPKDKDDDNRPNAVRSRTEILARKANQAMAKDVRENFQNKLEVLKEYMDTKKEPWELAGPEMGGGGGASRGGSDYASKYVSDYLNKLFKKEKTTSGGLRGKTIKADPFKTTPEVSKKLPGKDNVGGGKIEAPSFDKKSSEDKTSDDKIVQGLKDYISKKQYQSDVERTERYAAKVAAQKQLRADAKGQGTSAFTGMKAKKDAAGTSAFTGMSAKSSSDKAQTKVKASFNDFGAKNRVNPNPYSKPEPKITTIDTPSDGSETQTQKLLNQPLLNPAKSTTTGDTPGHGTSSSSATAGASSNAQSKGQPASAPSSSSPKNKKNDEEGTKKREPEDKPKGRMRPRFPLPKLAPGDVGAKALSAIAPGLKLAISGPKREGDPDAIRSRQASIERAALKAQASLKESVNLDGNVFELNNRAAEKVTALYESLNKKNKKKMVEMMNESAESLEKVISFAVRQ